MKKRTRIRIEIERVISLQLGPNSAPPPPPASPKPGLNAGTYLERKTDHENEDRS